ncbi:MAG: hypothetical protein ACF8OB_18590 [Phycisphaeraceae bacterium JB051]
MSRWNWILLCLVLLGLSCVSYAQSDKKATLTADEEQALMDAADQGPPPRGMMEDGPPRERRRDGQGPHRGGRPPEELNEQQLKHLFSILSEVNPELIDKIKTWQQVNPDRSNRMLARTYGRMQDLIQLKMDDPPMYELKVADFKLDTRSRVLSMSYRRTPTDELRNDLLAVLKQQFEIRQKIREHELERLKAKIGELESQLQERASNREKIIDKQFQNMTNKPVNRKW